MSKYTEAIEEMQLSDFLRSKDAEIVWLTMKSIQTIREALETADRLESADANVYNKCCEVCTSLTICKERDEVCDEASAWEDGYNRALADMRGDTE